MTTRQKFFWWTTRLALLLSALCGIVAATEWVGEVSRWFALGAALFGGLATWADTHLPSASLFAGLRKTTLPVVVLLATTTLVGCPKPYQAAWNTTYQVREVGQLAENLIAKKASMEHKKCLQAYGGRTDAYAECIAPYHEGLIFWKQIVEPTLNAALIGTVAAIQIAERAGDNKMDWKKELQPGACALIRMATEYENLLMEKARDVLQYLKAAEAWICD